MYTNFPSFIHVSISRVGDTLISHINDGELLYKHMRVSPAIHEAELSYKHIHVYVYTCTCISHINEGELLYKHFSKNWGVWGVVGGPLLGMIRKSQRLMRGREEEMPREAAVSRAGDTLISLSHIRVFVWREGDLIYMYMCIHIHVYVYMSLSCTCTSSCP